MPLDIIIKPENFASKDEVRWCPGCGNYAILKTVREVMASLSVAQENIVFVSGIGCSGRFPYYMETYGLHTIHGRAPAFATGIKLANPKLSVWVVIGDGDGLSIGANHLLHALRRNVDIKILLFNNRIYGLTKGQYSPTSEQGKKTNTTPAGSIDYPLDAIPFALTAGATFVARSLDVDLACLKEVLLQAAQHKGSAFVEIYQNCNVFNDGTFASISERSEREERILYLRDNEPYLFGKEKNKTLWWNEDHFEVSHKLTENQTLHRTNLAFNPLHYALTQLTFPDFPTPMGIFKQIEKPTYDEMHALQVEEAKQKAPADLEKLFHAGDTWKNT